MTKLNEIESTWKPAEVLAMARATACNAPIAVAYNQVSSARVHQSSGSRFSPQKRFVDLRNGRKISLGQAKEILFKFEKAA